MKFQTIFDPSIVLLIANIMRSDTSKMLFVSPLNNGSIVYVELVSPKRLRQKSSTFGEPIVKYLSFVKNNIGTFYKAFFTVKKTILTLRLMTICRQGSCRT